MQCPKINLFSFNINQKAKNNCNNYNNNYYSNVLCSPKEDVFVKTDASNLSFSGITSGGDLKSLLNRRKIHCIYCGIPMLSNKKIENLKKSGIFSAPIRDFAQEMLSYLDYLHPTEKEVLKKITIMAFDSPNIRLSEAIKKLYYKANYELLKVQMPIINQLYGLSNKLPPNIKNNYQKLLKISRYKLEEKAYIPESFDAKEFVYKIKRINKSIKDEYLASKILKLSEPITHPILTEKMPVNDKFTSKILNLCEIKYSKNKKYTPKELQLLLIEEIKKYSEIMNRHDIANLCDTAIKTIEKQPVKIKFSNKTLEKSLFQILQDYDNKKVKNKIISLIEKLPNSETSTNAFIAKHQFADSESIAYDLLRPSIGTIEHIHPKSKDGPNELWNYALACERDNGNRSNGDLSLFIIEHSKKNQQRYFDELIDEVNKHNLNKNTLLKMIKNFTKESGVPIDTSKLK